MGHQGSVIGILLIQEFFFLVNNTSHCMVSVRRRSFILPPDRFNTTKGNYKVVEMRLVIKLDFNLPD